MHPPSSLHPHSLPGTQCHSQALLVRPRPWLWLLLQMPGQPRCWGVTLPACLDGDMGQRRWPRAGAGAGAGWLPAG